MDEESKVVFKFTVNLHVIKFLKMFWFTSTKQLLSLKNKAILFSKFYNLEKALFVK